MIKDAFTKVKRGENLSRSQVEGVFTDIMTGKADTDSIASFLLALKEKGETIEEITGAALIMRKFAEKIKPNRNDLIDTCGTGGDCQGTFNISTVSALVCAGAGCAVAKHGNKSVSSKCGSANLLEELGVNINVDKDIVLRSIDAIGIGFLFAPNFHPAMRYAMAARGKIKTRTVFNILGPLTNPAGAKRQVIGVFDKELLGVLAKVLKNLGLTRAMIVHGRDGLDEVTVQTITDIAELEDGNVKFYELDPAKYKIKLCRKEDLLGGEPSENAKIAMKILRGEKGPKRSAVLLNAGCAIYIAGIANDIEEGVKRAEESIDSGKALSKLEELKKITNAK
ncbi:MAG: anthranilate phosphoribosyltransferase [Candidatus Omnitrophica bacterium]|nr:anthranilate phosphoribosyltransferase [Candidatus Omnitrophota bacterium]